MVYYPGGAGAPVAATGTVAKPSSNVQKDVQQPPSAQQVIDQAKAGTSLGGVGLQPMPPSPASGGSSEIAAKRRKDILKWWNAMGGKDRLALKQNLYYGGFYSDDNKGARSAQSQYLRKEDMDALDRLFQAGEDNGMDPADLVNGAAGEYSGLSGGGSGDEETQAIALWGSLDSSSRTALKSYMYYGGFYTSPDTAANTIGSDLLVGDDMDALKTLVASARYNNIDPFELAQVYGTQGMSRGVPLNKKQESGSSAAALTKLGVQTEQELRQFAAANGITLSDQYYKTAFDLVVNDQSSVEELVQRLRKDYVIGAYPAWQQQLEAGANVEDLASPYMRAMENILQVPVSLNDPTIKQAMQFSVNGQPSVKPLYEFEQELRNDPRYEYTDEAKNQMGSIAMTLAKTFGVK